MNDFELLVFNRQKTNLKLKKWIDKKKVIEIDFKRKLFIILKLISKKLLFHFFNCIEIIFINFWRIWINSIIKSQ
jgi:hypothetical protein